MLGVRFLPFLNCQRWDLFTTFFYHWHPNLLISHLYTYHFYYFDRFYFYLIFSYFFANTPCTTISTWDIPSYTTRELLFFPTFSTPVYLFHIQFFILNKSKIQHLPHLQKNCCQVLPTPLEDAQMPCLSGF